MKTLGIEKTKKGLPAMWECGGSGRNTGTATIIADLNGGRKKPIYVRKKGTLSNDRHALFVVQEGDLVIEASHHREDFTIKVFRITNFTATEALVERLYCFDCGEWDSTPSSNYLAAIQAAQEKALEYHCRRPIYWVEE